MARVRNVADISTYVYPYARRFSPGASRPCSIRRSRAKTGPIRMTGSSSGCRLRRPRGRRGGRRRNIETALANKELEATSRSSLHTERWHYFPHVDVTAMQAGFYDDLEALQGEFHTWYTGELLAFTLVELIVTDPRELVDRYFA